MGSKEIDRVIYGLRTGHQNDNAEFQLLSDLGFSFFVSSKMHLASPPKFFSNGMLILVGQQPDNFLPKICPVCPRHTATYQQGIANARRPGRRGQPQFWQIAHRRRSLCGTFVEIHCSICNGNATSSNSERLRSLNGIASVHHHMRRVHDTKLNIEAATRVMCSRQFAIEEICALNNNSPNAPQIEMVQVMHPSDATNAITNLPLLVIWTISTPISTILVGMSLNRSLKSSILQFWLRYWGPLDRLCGPSILQCIGLRFEGLAMNRENDTQVASLCRVLEISSLSNVHARCASLSGGDQDND
jgi:hypothetical protein